MTSTTEPYVLAVIPARLASTRFPRKLLAPLAGKPLLLHTYERTQRAKRVSETVIATDSEEIAEALKPFGAKVVMTRSDHATGTDRVAEVAEQSDAAFVVNVQGDEALIDPAAIDQTIAPLLADATLEMSTACHALADPRDINDPNVVKVVCDRNGRALYFSRSPIPSAGPDSVYRHHIGLYAFRREFLLEYARMDPTPLEKAESLEQLRALENGHAIAVVETLYQGIGVDTPDDLERVRKILEMELVN
ncbi:MAG: 3-deoxy-manno-octulosonate cytidylyltransferase [Candidatus Hydrogenedentes bacterium]|nr:3-deoxy-manno-octulosonate cytidylyltransferase [Candidatus Hydrogenedentota bacterium]